MNNYAIVIHGGAGTILKSSMTEEKELRYKTALNASLDEGFDKLKNGASAIEAVESAIMVLENSPLFNAGKGAVFNALGKHEMDASIMDGKTLNAGAVAAVPNLKNPIRLAKRVLTDSDHVLLIGDGAKVFGDKHQHVFEADEYFHDDHRFAQWQKIKETEKFQLDHSESDKKYLGTVGAVALDQHGNIAAGTSTGGMTNKKFGRVGDSPIIGAGNYANNKTCAVSCTGSGEYFMRALSAYDVSCLMEYQNLSLKAASEKAILEKLTQLGGDGGLIAIDTDGNIAMPFNCEGMYRGFMNANERAVYIYK